MTARSTGGTPSTHDDLASARHRAEQQQQRDAPKRETNQTNNGQPNR
jgi:hypothetical protein